MTKEQQIAYGWQDTGSVYLENAADVYHAECAPNVSWITCRADASAAAEIDGHGHTTCNKCYGLLIEPPRSAEGGE